MTSDEWPLRALLPYTCARSPHTNLNNDRPVLSAAQMLPGIIASANTKFMRIFVLNNSEADDVPKAQ